MTMRFPRAAAAIVLALLLAGCVAGTSRQVTVGSRVVPAEDVPAVEDGPELLAPPDVPGAEPAARPTSAARPGSSAYDQAVGCAAGYVALLMSRTYPMSQNEAEAMTGEADAWQVAAEAISSRAGDDIARMARTLNDAAASRIVAACPPAP
jgi:hypothetical protein